MRTRWFTFSLCFATFTLGASVAAQPAKPSAQPRQGLPVPAAVANEQRGPDGQPVDPAGQRGISPFMIKILKGNAAYAARNFAGSVTRYREAILEDAEHPLGHYMLGQAQLAAGNLAEAEASYNAGLRFAKTNKRLYAKLLFVLADLHERQAKWADAKQGFGAYAAYCRANPDANGYPASAEGRIKAIDKREEVAKQATLVKERMEKREKELALPAQAATK